MRIWGACCSQAPHFFPYHARMSMKRIEVTADCIWLYSDFADRFKCAGLPGARWVGSEEAWNLPATPGTWEQVREAFPEDAKSCGLDIALAWRKDAHLPNERYGANDYEHTTQPWTHQVRGTRFATMMDSCLLHCWMGTGKTKITLDAIRTLGHKRTLVICPSCVVPVWETQADTHAPGIFSVLALGKGKSTVKRTDVLSLALRHEAGPLIVVVNYEAAWQKSLGKGIAKTEWDCIVLDESHRVKAPGSKCSRFVAKLKAKHKLCLTGTPMPHSPLDIYGQYRFLDPGIFGTRFTAFRARYAIMGGFENRVVVGYQNQDDFRMRLDKLRLHVTADVLDLPPIQTIDRRCPLEPAARKLYDQLERELIAELGEGVITAANALVKLLRLQQICGGAVPADDEDKLTEVSTAKRNLLAEMLEDLQGERVVVFARFRYDLGAARAEAERLGYRVGEISGSANDYKQWCESDELDLLVVQTQAGGLGIDLTAARVAIFYSLGFSLGDYQQAIARVHRPGQTRPTVIYRLLAVNTVDVRIVQALRKRENVIESILGDLRGD